MAGMPCFAACATASATALHQLPRTVSAHSIPGVSSARRADLPCLSCPSSTLRFGSPGPERGGRRLLRLAALPLDRSPSKDGSGGASEASDPGAGETGRADEEPWTGAVLFKRSAVRRHYEYWTSLERLGLGFLSTESSRSVAVAMGIAPAASSGLEDVDAGRTPVSISIDVTRDEDTRDLRLDGTARTTAGLCCNRCLSPVVERIFASFSLLLTEKPVLEPTQQRIGVVIGGEGPANDGPELDLELDDKLHFPKETKEIDLSKYLRDSVHLEIPVKSLCSVQCNGMCLTCGKNLNEGTCDCTIEEVRPSWGPLEQLRKQLLDQEGLS